MSAREVRLILAAPILYLELLLVKTIEGAEYVVKSEKNSRFTIHVGWRTKINDSRWRWWTR